MASLQVNIEEALVTLVRMEKVRAKLVFRNVYDEAVSTWLDRRESLDGRDGLEREEAVRRLYFASPQPSDDCPATRVTVTLEDERLEHLKEWAERDGRTYADAIYSALLPRFEEMARCLSEHAASF